MSYDGAHFPLGHHLKFTDADESDNFFSDDTGFFSATEDLGESSCVIRPESPLYCPLSNYEKLLKKYLDNKNIPDIDPFSDILNFEEMLQMLTMSADISGLNKTAQILDFVVLVWKRQVTICYSQARSLAELCRGHKHKEVTATVGTLNESEEEFVRRKQSRTPRKQFVVDQNQISLSFHDAVPDVIHRRKTLAAKFYGIGYDTLLDCEFNIHAFYEHDDDVSSFTRSSSHLVPRILHQMRHQLTKYYSPHDPLLPQFVSLEDSDEEGLEMEDIDPENQTENVDLRQIEDLAPENENTSVIEVENREPVLVDPLLGPLGTSMSDLNNLKELVPESQKKEKSVNSSVEGGPKDRLRKRSARVPFEPLKPANPLNQMQDDEMPSIEMKRSKLDDSGIVMDITEMASVIVDERVYDTDALGATDAEVATSFDQLHPNPEISDLNGCDSDFRTPSPVNAENFSTGPIRKSKRHKRVDMQALIDQLDNVVLDEIFHKKRVEVPFDEIVKKSKIEITPCSSSYQENVPISDESVSVQSAFFACLHLAHIRKLFLASSGDIFTITTVKPEDPPSSALLQT